MRYFVKVFVFLLFGGLMYYNVSSTMVEGVDQSGLAMFEIESMLAMAEPEECTIFCIPEPNHPGCLVTYSSGSFVYCAEHRPK